MSYDDDELARLLGDAFDAKARRDVGDSAAPPPPRFASEAPARDGSRPGRRLARIAAPLTAAAAVIAVVLLVLGISSSSDGNRRQAAGSRTAPAATSPSAQNSGKPVHIKLLNADGSKYGVGMPVIAYFSVKITDARPLQRATSASVNGKTVQGAWYFERSQAHKGYPIEAHFRLKHYWPAHARIHVGLPVRGLSAGAGLAYDNSLTLDFATGASNVLTVDDATHMLTVTRDGRTTAKFPVSLGAKNTPTQRGIKVIMEKGASICMSGPSYQACGVKDTQRLTYAGEYLHAAPWNVHNIDNGVDSSNGCTNLAPSAAKKLFAMSEVGDVVRYPNADGPQMHIGQGYGDWNVAWSDWQTGGLVRTH